MNKWWRSYQLKRCKWCKHRRISSICQLVLEATDESLFQTQKIFKNKWQRRTEEEKEGGRRRKKENVQLKMWFLAKSWAANLTITTRKLTTDFQNFRLRRGKPPSRTPSAYDKKLSASLILRHFWEFWARQVWFNFYKVRVILVRLMRTQRTYTARSTRTSHRRIIC